MKTSERRERIMCMTVKWRAAAALFFIAAAVVWAAPDAGAEYLGDVCWTIDTGRGQPSIMQFGVSLAGSHIALTGRTNTFGVIVPVTGSAEVVPGQIRIQYTFSSPGGLRPPATQTYIIESGLMMLDIISLTGTVQMIDTRRDGTAGTITQTYLTGTASPVVCPP